MATDKSPKTDRKLLVTPPLVFLAERDYAELLESCSVRVLAKDEGLMPKGMVPDELFIPAAGDLRESSLDLAEGEQLPLYQPVGLDCLLNEEPFASPVFAAGETTVYVFPWAKLQPLLLKTPGLREYLRLVTSSSVVRDMDLALGEMGCAPPFRAALLGELRHETLDSGTWIGTEGEVPGSIFYPVVGTIRSYLKMGESAIKPLWLVRNMTWQAWKPCLEQSPAKYAMKTVSRTELYRLPWSALRSLRERFPKDFESFAELASPAVEERVEEAPEGEERRREPKRVAAEKMRELFPPIPRPPSRSISFPFVRQDDHLQDGPCCLSMVSRFFGNALSTRYWTSRMSTDHHGVSLFDLADAAEKAGFVCHGLEVPDLRVVDPSLLPLVAHRGDHFEVVYAIDGNRLVCADPAVGVARTDWDDFRKRFAGHVLMLKPTDQFYGQKDSRQGYGHYIAMFRGHGFELAMIFASSVLVALLSTAPAFLSQFIIDQVLAKKDTELLALGIGAAVLLSALIALAEWLRHYYLAFLNSRFDFGSASAFLRKLYTLPYEYFATRHVGDFTRRLAELERIREFMTRRLVKTALSFLNLAVYGVVLFSYNATVALAIFASAPILTGLSVLFSKHLRRFYNEIFLHRSEQDGLIADQIRGIASIKALGAEVAARWRYEEALVGTLKSKYKFALTASTLDAMSTVLRSVIDYGIMGLAAFMAIRGEMSLGQVVSVSILAGGVVSPFDALAKMWSEVQEVQTVLERLNDVFLADSEQQPSSRALVKRRLRGEIEFRDVWFRYGGESAPWVLKGLSFRIQAGQRVAIVGPSGAGKSTLALLTARFYEPHKGAIFIDGRDYREYDRQWLRRHIGLLVQENDLFRGSILENIAYGDPRPDVFRVEWAAQMAQVAEFVQEKPSGYDYMLSHGGKGLSGGQKQRIAIARILYANPTVLFLDEGTSSLDPISERAILSALKERSRDQDLAKTLQRGAEERSSSLSDALKETSRDRALLEALDQSSRDRTLISIMHRYALVKMYDFIVVVQGGRVAELGTHEELLRQGGLYTQLYNQDSKS